jgi:hypothetical protein
MNEKYEKALKAGMKYCVSYIVKGDDPKKPWNQTFFKLRKEADYWEKWILSRGGRALVSGMIAPLDL